MNNKIPNATRPLEYVCLFQADVATEKDGDVFIYIAVDAYSRKLFFTGTERERSEELVLKHTQRLLENNGFKIGMSKYGAFTLVYHKYQNSLTELNKLLKPCSGNAIVNELYVTHIALPVIEQLVKTMYKKQ